jgi:outer membrane protein assembly factor BamB
LGFGFEHVDWSGVAVGAGELLYVASAELGNAGDIPGEAVVCWSVANGRLLWVDALSANHLAVNAEADRVAASDEVSLRVWRGNGERLASVPFEGPGGLGIDTWLHEVVLVGRSIVLALGPLQGQIDRQAELVCVGDDGALRWRQGLGARGYSGPVVVGGEVFCLVEQLSEGSDDRGAWLLLPFGVATGRRIGDTHSQVWPNGTTRLVASPDALFAYCDTAGEFARLDPETGAPAWAAFDTRLPGADSLCATSEALYAVGATSYTQSAAIALSADTGRELWRTEMEGVPHSSSPCVVHGGLLFVLLEACPAVGVEAQPFGTELVAMDITNGQVSGRAKGCHRLVTNMAPAVTDSGVVVFCNRGHALLWPTDADANPDSQSQ